MELAEFVTAVRERQLGENNHHQQDQDDLLPAFHKKGREQRAKSKGAYRIRDGEPPSVYKERVVLVFAFRSWLLALRTSPFAPSLLKIDRRDVLADTAAKVGHFHVLRMYRVSIERGAFAKHRYQTRVVRTCQAKRIESNREAFHLPDDRGQVAQSRHVLFADRLLDILTVFPHDDMSQHCPEISSFFIPDSSSCAHRRQWQYARCPAGVTGDAFGPRQLERKKNKKKFPAKAQRRKGNKESELRPALLLRFHLRLRRALTEKKSQYNPWQLFFASLRLCGKLPIRA